MRKLVSIIIPIYNAEKTLRQCLESVINQTYQKLEIILINDGSTDNSSQICYEYKNKDSRIIVVDNQIQEYQNQFKWRFFSIYDKKLFN